MDIPLYSLPQFRYIPYQRFRCIAYQHSIEHKPAHMLEIDFAGSKLDYVDPDSGE